MSNGHLKNLYRERELMEAELNRLPKGINPDGKVYKITVAIVCVLFLIVSICISLKQETGGKTFLAVMGIIVANVCWMTASLSVSWIFRKIKKISYRGKLEWQLDSLNKYIEEQEARQKKLQSIQKNTGICF